MGLFLLVLYVAYSTTLHTMFDRWMQLEEAYSHGFLVVGFGLFVLFELSRISSKTSNRVRYLSIVGIGAATIVWFVAKTIGLGFIAQERASL